MRGCAVAVFGSLPELPFVFPRERRPVLLGLVHENSAAFLEQLLRADGHGHLDFMDGPLMPGAPVEPHPAVLHPILILQALERFYNGVEANAVGIMRVGQVAGGVYLMRLDLCQQVHDDLDIGFAEIAFSAPAGFVERHIEEVDMLVIQSAKTGAGAGFTPSDQAFDLAGFRYIGFIGLFALDEFLDLVEPFQVFLRIQPLALVKLIHELEEAECVVVMDGDIAGGLVGDVYIVALFDEPQEGAAHGDDVVIGVGAEDDDPFPGGFGAFGPVGIVGIRFAARPAGDGMLEPVEHLDVDAVGGGVFQGQVAQAVFGIIFIGQLENGFSDRLGQPDNGLTDQLIVPVAHADQPRRFDPGQVFRGGLVQYDPYVGVFLQVGGRNA